jgi:subfamily B ATP-binding cassette protein MsbA
MKRTQSSHQAHETPESQEHSGSDTRVPLEGDTINENRAATSRFKLDEKKDRDPRSERQAVLRFLAYLKPYLPLSTLAVLCGIVNYGVSALIPSITGYIIDRYMLHPGNAHETALKHTERVNPLYVQLDHFLHAVAPQAGPVAQVDMLLGTAIACVVLSGVVMFTRVILINVGGQRVIFKVRNDLYEHIQGLSLSFFQQNRSGSIVSRLTSDIAQAQNFVGNACAILWMDALSVIGIGIWLFTIHPRMALMSLIVFPFWIASVRQFGKRIRAVAHDVQEGMSELSGQVQEKIAAATVVQAFAREKRETRLFHRVNRNLFDRQVKSWRCMAGNAMASTILMGVAPLIVLMYGAQQVIEGKISTGMLITFWSTLGLFYFPLQRLTDLSAVISNSMAAIERIFDVFDLQSDVQDAAYALPLPSPIRGEIELKNVSFRYEESDMILKNLDLRIEPGEVVAFVGPSGAGKSTLINLIPRFYDVADGQIAIDGLDIRDVKVKSLRRNIGMVLQDNILFTGTIRDNILYGRPGAEDDEIVNAAVMANAHDFIESLPEGYETQIGERGTKLSGGQKQRIAITRAFLRDPRILILDEATSALDSESEQLIQSALNKLMVGRTTLIIAHRLSTIMHADKIVAMKDGRIVEVGRHQELLERRGLYYHLYKAQFEHALSLPMPDEWGAGPDMSEPSLDDRCGGKTKPAENRCEGSRC